MHVVCQEGSSAYGKRTGHIGHTRLVSCSGPQYFIGLMSYSWSLQQCNIVSTRFGNKQPVLRKPFVLHWDGEMFPEIRGGRSIDRIAVLVTGYGHEKLPNVSDGTGGDAGPSCIDFIRERHVPERMKVLSLNKSASNTTTCLPSMLAPYA